MEKSFKTAGVDLCDMDYYCYHTYEHVELVNVSSLQCMDVNKLLSGKVRGRTDRK